ncbi:MAG: DUF4157 domain-containing protein [Blastocatellia bacterium]|nr:DUF4157 domain-containing protein [Blastocatellia bacterium]
MDSILIEQVVSNPGNGKPIPPQIKNEIEMRFNVDLSNVKVYTGPESKMILNRVGADAYAKGDSIFIESELDNAQLRQVLINNLSAHERQHQVTMKVGKDKAVSNEVDVETKLDGMLFKK